LNRASTALLIVGFGLMTVLALHGRTLAAVGGASAMLAAVNLFRLVARGSGYVATGAGLLWLAIGLAGLVLLFWSWS
jgi:hypothetical protein